MVRSLAQFDLIRKKESANATPFQAYGIGVVIKLPIKFKRGNQNEIGMVAKKVL